MSNELLEALNILEQEKNISKETLLEAIENSLVTACKNHFGKSDNVKVEIDPETCAFSCYQEKTVVDTVEDPVEEISLADAHKVNGNYQLGDIVRVEVKSKEFYGLLKAYDKDTVTITDEDGNETTFNKSDIALIRQALDF